MAAVDGSNKKGQTLNSQKQQCVVNIREYFQQEKDNGGPLLPVNNVIQRTADALKVSKMTILRVLKKPESVTPPKSRSHMSNIIGINNFDVDAVRRHIHNYYQRREYPTLKKILVSLTEVGLYRGRSANLLRKALQKVNFKFRKYGNRAVLMERNNIVKLRVQFLRIARGMDWSKVVFLGETWVNANYCIKNSWTDKSSQVPVEKGGCLVVCHAGTINGFIPGALLLFQSKKTGDYHEEMDSKRFKTWLTKCVLPKIEKKSIILMDNAPCHSMQINREPTASSEKTDIIAWLHRNNVSCTEDLYKSELLHLVKSNKSRMPQYEIDQIVHSQGHRVVRIPPYHSQYNAIELIWSQIKEYIAANKFQGLKAVEELLHDGVNSISNIKWENAVQHVKQICEQDWVAEGAREEAQEQISINLGPEESSDDDSTDSEFCDYSLDQSMDITEIELLDS